MKMELGKSVVVIGAGIGGIICAQRLAAAGYAVTLFDKSRGVGGRVATRRGDADGQFDHGAQYFTVQSPQFMSLVETWLAAEVAAPWAGRIVKLQSCKASPTDSAAVRYVGQPSMNSLAKFAARELTIRTGSFVTALERAGQQWMLKFDSDDHAGPFDIVLVNVPAPQAVPLLPAQASFRSRLAEVQMSGCWAVMVQFNRPLPVPFDGAFVADSPLGWIARNNSKPGRHAAECWVLHGSPEWSDAHLELAPEAARDLLLDAFWRATGLAASEPASAVAHRWRYALPKVVLDDSCFFDARLAVGACGDWCAGPRLEGAALSGLALADRVLDAERVGDQ
jgi:predicted NAD/FAD-dependent oxidoreductase